jgi:AraC-like DNA-binding protein
MVKARACELDFSLTYYQIFLHKSFSFNPGIDMKSAGTVIKARVFDGFREFLAPYRLELNPLLVAAGLDPTTVAVSSNALPLNAVAHVFEVAAARAKEPCLGLKFALAYPPGGTGPLGQLVRHAPTLRQSVSVIPAFVEAMVAPAEVTYREDEAGRGILTWVLPLDLTTPAIQYVSLCAAVTIWGLRAVAGEAWYPEHVTLPHRPLPCADLVASVFGRHVVFDGPNLQLVIDRASLNLKSEEPDPRLYDTLLMAGAADIMRVEVPLGIVVRVQRKIHAMLTEKVPDLNAIAFTLSLQPRALQWQLSQAGTSFERVLNDTRRQIAESMLASSDLPMTEIAHAVGFSDSSSFTRACKAWFDMSPSAFRANARNPDTTAIPTPGTSRAGQEPADD